jgi:hypothetical protein
MRKNKVEKQEKNVIEEVLDFADTKKGLMFIVANPLKDEVVVTFGGKAHYGRFPVMADPKNNILVQMMTKSNFKESMNEFLTMLIKTTGINQVDGKQFYQVIGGAVQSMVKEK